MDYSLGIFCPHCDSLQDRDNDHTFTNSLQPFTPTTYLIARPPSLYRRNHGWRNRSRCRCECESPTEMPHNPLRKSLPHLYSVPLKERFWDRCCSRKTSLTRWHHLGAKIHHSICRFLEETGQASNPRSDFLPHTLETPTLFSRLMNAFQSVIERPNRLLQYL